MLRTNTQKTLARTLTAVALLGAFASGVFAADSTRYRADVYGAYEINRQQEVRVVEILSIGPAQIAVDNTESRARAQGVGALLGAVTGAVIGNHGRHTTNSRVGGGLIGGLVGGIAGTVAGGIDSTAYENGVQIVFRTPSGRIFQSAQVGSVCEYRLGPAPLVSTYEGETRVQPNNPYGCRR